MKGGSGVDRDRVQTAGLRDIASKFVNARLAARPLKAYPGDVPQDLKTGYICQDHAIDLWPDEIRGWKVGRIPPALEGVYHSDRLAGPIFEKSIRYANNGEALEMRVFAGGFAAVEAEYVAVIGSDAPAGKTNWSLDEAAAMIRDLRLGLEIASSPLRTINQLGPAVIVSDFGNNAGLIVGKSIRNWRQRDLESMSCEAFIEGSSVGTGGAFRLTGGPVRSVQFMLQLAADRGRPLHAGDVIATGQTTGIHEIAPGELARIVFDCDGEVRCKVVAATA
jgi:2-keto-4-pentenoate hydratase